MGEPRAALARGWRSRDAPKTEGMRFVLYLSVVFWVALAVVSMVDIGATARLFHVVHLG